MQRKTILLVVAVLVYMFHLPAKADSVELEQFSGVKNLKIGGQWFISYENGQFRGGDINRFILNRGYLVVEKQLSDNLLARITPDVSVDEEGDGRGDIEMRLKYLYLRYKLPSLGFITSPHVETGIIHRPWLSFEQSINHYRVQGTMYLERVRIFNSADYGVAFFGSFGGHLDEEYQKQVNKQYPGRYGSVSIGIHNGGGYHAIEENNNKTIETRLSIRPLPELLPGLQFSHGGCYGKGNEPVEPVWNLNVGMVSYEAPLFTFTGQYFIGLGNSYGTLLDAEGQSIENSGYSLFGEIQLPSQTFSLFGRYDYWDADHPDATTFRVISGVVFHLHEKSKLVLSGEYYDDKQDQVDPLTTLLKFDLEVKF